MAKKASTKKQETKEKKLVFKNKNNEEISSADDYAKYRRKNGFTMSDEIEVKGGNIRVLSLYSGVVNPFKTLVHVETDEEAFEGFKRRVVDAETQSDTILNHDNLVKEIKDINKKLKK